MNVTYVREASALCLEGELDLATVDSLKPALETAVAAGGPVVVEMSELRFMDSSGLHALIDAAKEIAKSGWCIYLHTDGGIVEKLLALVKADSFPNVHVSDHPGFTETLAPGV